MHFAALVVRNVVSDPCTKAQVETLFRERKNSYTNSKHQWRSRHCGDSATNSRANEAEHHAVAVRQAINDASRKR